MYVQEVDAGKIEPESQVSSPPPKMYKTVPPVFDEHWKESPRE
jgi:hypothetical protein